MKYVGIDVHKRYCVCAIQDEQGRLLGRQRISGDLGAGFVQLFKALGAPCRVAIEACWNWGFVYELLEAIPEIEEIIASHPLKNRLIAQSQIKTDAIDSNALATLLRGNFLARVHVPPRAARRRKDQLRQRLYWARLRTRIRNRMHALLDRQHGLELPQCSDLFGVRGMGFLRRLELPEPDASMLREDVALMDLLNAQIREQEKRIGAQNLSDPTIRRLLSIPGLGPILAPVIASEIDDITRFHDPEHLCAYAGLVPTTHSSGGRTYHGGLLWGCNRWLRWALIEGAWVAMGCSGYFGAFYTKQRKRGKAANTAITIVARRMCRIIFQLLTQQRDYSAAPPKTSPVAPVLE
jgi:transposase